MSEKLEHEGAELGRIHHRANYDKALSYWLGFLHGVLASDDIESAELAPLAAEAENFLSVLSPQAANFFIEDLHQLEVGSEKRAFQTISNILMRRERAYAAESEKAEINEFYGFCAGIACDNVISVKEVAKLLDRIPQCAINDQRIANLQYAAKLSIRDGIITPEESSDICSWISRLVGDSASDTGVATFGNVGVIEGSIQNHESLVFDGCTWVLTGKFSIGPRKAIELMISDRGGLFKNSVTKQTDYLGVAVTASRDWKHSHEGLKIIKALELREQGGKPNVVIEHVLDKALKA